MAKQRDIFTFGYYSVDSFVTLSLGKIGYALINMSLSHAMIKISKPGLGLKKQMLSALIMFVSTACQIFSKVYAITFLYNLKVDGLLKYPLYIMLSTLGIFLINSLTTIKGSEDLRKDWKSKMKSAGWELVTAACSLITKIDFCDVDKASPPSFLSHVFYQTFQLFTSLQLASLPWILPACFDNSMCHQYPFLKIILPWILANIFQVKL